VTALAAVLGALAVLLSTAPRADGVQRLSRLRPPSPRAPVVVVSAAAASAVAGIAVAVVVGLPAGALLGLVTAIAGPALLGRLEPRSVRQDRERLVHELPLLLDLLAACLAGGASLAAAATAVAAALPGPCGCRLASVVDALAVGCAPGEAWLELGGSSGDDPLAGPARLLARAAEGGTPVAGAVQRLAADARAASAAAASQAARRVGVLAVAPLGLCFLPAFVLLGVVPVVVGLAAPLIRSF
jgi:pilus assembly protein TadC